MTFSTCITLCPQCCPTDLWCTAHFLLCSHCNILISTLQLLFLMQVFTRSSSCIVPSALWISSRFQRCSYRLATARMFSCLAHQPWRTLCRIYLNQQAHLSSRPCYGKLLAFSSTQTTHYLTYKLCWTVICMYFYYFLIITYNLT